MNKADTSLTWNDHVEDIANLASHFVAVQNRQVKQDIQQKTSRRTKLGQVEGDCLAVG